MENIENIHIDTLSMWEELPLNMDTINSMFYSEHNRDCCEDHWLDFAESASAIITAWELLPTFDTIEIKGVDGMGILLRFSLWEKEAAVFIAGHSSNNGYYSTNLTLIYRSKNWEKKEYDISEYQSEYQE